MIFSNIRERTKTTDKFDDLYLKIYILFLITQKKNELKQLLLVLRKNLFISHIV